MTPTPLYLTLTGGMPYGLIVEHPTTVWEGNPPEPIKDELTQSIIQPHYLNYWQYCTPILRDLGDLTKEIKQDGERFVPYVLLMDEERKRQGYVDIEFKEMLVSLSRYPGLDSVEFWIIKRLLSWHFNIEQLPPDQFIPVTETFNPYK